MDPAKEPRTPFEAIREALPPPDDPTDAYMAMRLRVHRRLQTEEVTHRPAHAEGGHPLHVRQADPDRYCLAAAWRFNRN